MMRRLGALDNQGWIYSSGFILQVDTIQQINNEYRDSKIQLRLTRYESSWNYFQEHSNETKQL
jgi:hypothetical protein